MPGSTETRAWLCALGRGSPPPSLALGERALQLERVYKHDFFAATACYADQHGERVVVKLGRRAPVAGLPMRWLGRLATWNEVRALRELEGLACVPRLVARPEPHTLVRTHIPGRALGRGVSVSDGFFPALHAALDALHARGWAYVDLEKPQNVIVSEDGQPHLVDFQISWTWPRRLCSVWPFRWWLGVLQRADRYHALKLERRLRSAGMSAEALERSRHRPWFVRLHRRVARPLQVVRRGLLDRHGSRGERGEHGRIHADPPLPRASGFEPPSQVQR
jgi:hypothetical protein